MTFPRRTDPGRINRVPVQLLRCFIAVHYRCRPASFWFKDVDAWTWPFSLLLFGFKARKALSGELLSGLFEDTLTGAL